MSDFSHLADLDDEELEAAYREAQARGDWVLVTEIVKAAHRIGSNEISLNWPVKTTLNAKDVR